MRFEEGTNQCQDRHQLDQLRHSGFSVDASVHIPAGSSKTQEALSQYIARRMAVPPPLSLKKISIRENREATVVYYTSNNEFFKGKTESFPATRFLLELTQHMPGGAQPMWCGSPMRILAVITEPEEVKKILRHLVKVGRPPPGLDPTFV
jgi:hypothetical protein